MSARDEQCSVALLEYAYGELGPAEAQDVERHVAGCADCAGALAGMRGVRRVMGQLPEETAPEAGLESLLAYAEQSARRAAAGPAPAPGSWRRWLAPVLGLGALATLAFIALPVAREVRVPLPSTVAADSVAPAAPAPARLAEKQKGEAAEDVGAPVETKPVRDDEKSRAKAPGDEEGDRPGVGARPAAPKGAAEAREGEAATPPMANVVVGAARDLGLRGGGGTGRAHGSGGTAPAPADDAPSKPGLGALAEAGAGGGGVALVPRTEKAAVEGPPAARGPALARGVALDTAEREEDVPSPVRARAAKEAGADEAKKLSAPAARGWAEARAAPAMPQAMAVAQGPAPELPFPSLRRAVADAQGPAERQAALKRLCEAERAATPGRAPACDQLAREFPADGGLAR